MERLADIRRTNVIVVGSGIAGLSTALGLSGCTLLTRGRLGSGCSGWAQGGIAAAIDADDSAALHAADTVAVSGGIGDADVAEAVTAAAAGRIAWLQTLGTHFDLAPDGSLALGREAGHSARRIVHADGDATGAEVMRALTLAARARDDIDICEHHELIDLVICDGRIAGVLALAGKEHRVMILAPVVVLATGGLGGLYSHTTNPAEVSGDGIAIAARAGARLADLEFVQFHPTALAVRSDPVPLLTEALRGEGAVLVNDRGDRFMQGVHKDAELAPRDVVARAVWQQRMGGREVYLDASEAVGSAFPERFPTVWDAARRAGFDPRHQGLPVTPAEHYAMGGIATDTAGRTSIPGLWAVGECGSNGLHGANRLASNSLLEGMVTGAAAARTIAAADFGTVPAAGLLTAGQAFVGTAGVWSDGEMVATIRDLMWRHAGLVRSASGLHDALAILDRLAVRYQQRNYAERNMLQLARVIVHAALARSESRGAHWRTDCPVTLPGLARRHFMTVRPERPVELSGLVKQAA